MSLPYIEADQEAPLDASHLSCIMVPIPPNRSRVSIAQKHKKYPYIYHLLGCTISHKFIKSII